MTSSFDRNIERMRSAERRNLQQSTSQRTAMANLTGQKQIENARDIAEKLSGFSDSLKEWRREDIKQKQHEGKLAQREARLEDAQKLYQLSEELKTVKEQDTRYQEIKAEMLKIQGPSAYPDADRLAKLSPWQQVGYAQEKLRLYNESYTSKLEHAMANSTKAITIAGVTFTPKELHDNNISDPVLKDAAIQVIGNDIREAAELDRFSPEMLKLAGTSDAMTKAKDGQLAKYRQRYNIESSANTRGKAALEWKNSAKTGDDVYRYLLVNGATVDKSGNILGNSGAWGQFDSQLVSEGVASDDPEYAKRILDQRIPDALAAKLGVKKGTTFAQHWPTKAETLRSQIKDGIKKKVDAENDWLQTAGKDLENKFIKDAREGNLTSAEVNKYKDQFGELGLTIPNSVTKYETVSDRNQRKDEDLIEALMASQRGYISHEQLDEFHPLAAAPHREAATKLEKAALKEFGSNEKIKSYLDTVWDDMGVKNKEKSIDYIEAKFNAQADYARKYNRYVAMGYRPEDASHLALHANQVTDKRTGEVIPDSMGVLAEIKANGANSKYIKTGQSIMKDLKPGHIRTAKIREGKMEILNDPNIINTGIIGGDYGNRQINIIKNNIDKFGARGLYMDKGALAYYEGLARGRNPRFGGYWGIVDAQLKAAGHPGLNPEDRPSAVSLGTGKDANGNTLPDPRGTAKVDRSVSRAMNYSNQPNNLYINNMLQDGTRNGKGLSVWDRQENLSWYTMGGLL